MRRHRILSSSSSSYTAPDSAPRLPVMRPPAPIKRITTPRSRSTSDTWIRTDDGAAKERRDGADIRPENRAGSFKSGVAILRFGVFISSSFLVLFLLSLAPVDAQRRQRPNVHRPTNAAAAAAAAAAGTADADAASCPSRCLCFRTTVRCMFLQMREIPTVAPETTILDLRFNRIHHIPIGSFKGLNKLNTLLLNNNHIRKIKSGAFEGLDNLRYLYLYKNEISVIEPNAFIGLNRLEQLYVHFNRIKELSPETFAHLPALERLFLHNNKLRTIPVGTFTHLQRLKRLRLDSNALICDCKMMWLAKMLSDSKTQTEAAATCQSPVGLQGKPLTSLTPEEFHCKVPRIKTEPNSVETSSGKTVYLTCKAEGDPVPEITWFHNSNELTDLDRGGRRAGRHQLLEDGTLMIKEATPADQGFYECMAKNILGQVKTSAVQLKYRGKGALPTFAKKPSDVSVVEGGVAVFGCQATSSSALESRQVGSPPPEVQWTKDEAFINFDARINPRFQLIDGDLRIEPTKKGDAGVYECRVTSGFHSISASARLTVQVPPHIFRRPADGVSAEGASVNFRCRAHGTPTPVIAWYKDGSVLRSTRRLRIGDEGASLLIAPVVAEDRGIYECRATNSFGSKTARAKLSVTARVPPQLVSTPPTRMEAAMESVVHIACSATGEPAPVMKWAHNGVEIRLGQHESHRITKEGLTILNVTQRHGGRYDCVAENSAGYATAHATLYVKDDPFSSTNHLDNRIPPIISETVDAAVREVDVAINRTVASLHDRRRPKSPNDLMALLRFPEARTLEIARAAEIYETTLRLLQERLGEGHRYNVSSTFDVRHGLSEQHLDLIANMSGCRKFDPPPDCQNMCYHYKYRTADGTCNNLRKPKWGSSHVALKRLLPPRYENGFNTPVGWDVSRRYNSFPVPNARSVSTSVISTRTVTPDARLTHMVMQWGQFIDHDITHTTMAASRHQFSDGERCVTTCSREAPCFPIETPHDDQRIRNHRCMEFIRSSAVCGTGSTSVLFERPAHREQINQITSFLDASNVYGSTEHDANLLRDPRESQRGKLRTGLVMHGKGLLPFNVDSPVDCQIGRENEDRVPCFLAGDLRANEQLSLTAMHTVWVREHNRVAERLGEVNPHWDADTVYQESRKIVGGVMQHITFQKWLPKILGPTGMSLLGAYKGYDPNTDSTVSNAFATAAFRFGHTLINPIMFRLNASFKPIPEGDLPLHRAFFSPYRLIEEGGIDPLLRGLFGKSAKEVRSDELLNAELTERLFGMAHAVALDLAALNVQRGRDHGLPSFNAYRTFCNLSAFESWDDEGIIESAEIRRSLERLYGHPDNVELWVGGLLERSVAGSKVGPTFMCLLVDQFRRIRDGDRFWYENPGVFKPEQLTQIKQSSLARVVCDNADNITRVQPDVFTVSRYPEEMVSCDDLPQVDLRFWTECCQDLPRSIPPEHYHCPGASHLRCRHVYLWCPSHDRDSYFYRLHQRRLQWRREEATRARRVESGRRRERVEVRRRASANARESRRLGSVQGSDTYHPNSLENRADPRIEDSLLHSRRGDSNSVQAGEGDGGERERERRYEERLRERERRGEERRREEEWRRREEERRRSAGARRQG